MRKLLFLLAMASIGFAAAESVRFDVGAFHFESPDGWGWIEPSSPMRKAELSVPGADGQSASVAFFHFGPGQGGSPEDNIHRWAGQFDSDNAMEKSEQYGKTKVWFVTASGTFKSGMPGGPATPVKDYALRGVILESADGNVFVKMTGPAAVVTDASDAFDRMIEAAAKSAP